MVKKSNFMVLMTCKTSSPVGEPVLSGPVGEPVIILYFPSNYPEVNNFIQYNVETPKQCGLKYYHAPLYGFNCCFECRQYLNEKT